MCNFTDKIFAGSTCANWKGSAPSFDFFPTTSSAVMVLCRLDMHGVITLLLPWQILADVGILNACGEGVLVNHAPAEAKRHRPRYKDVALRANLNMIALGQRLRRSQMPQSL
jgi:hypothetical protein